MPLPAGELDPLRPTPWRVFVGVLVPAGLFTLCWLWWATLLTLGVFLLVEIALFVLALVPRRPAPWVDRWHGRSLLVGSVVVGCGAGAFVPAGVVTLARWFVGDWAPPLWWPFVAVIVAGPLLIGTTRVYWRTADGLARRAFEGRSRLPRRELERTFE